MKKIAAIVIAATIIALGAAASAVYSDAPDCITAGLNDDSCVWKPELASVAVKVEYKYPYCEIKHSVEHNLRESPEGIVVYSGTHRLHSREYNEERNPVPIMYYSPPGSTVEPLTGRDWPVAWDYMPSTSVVHKIIPTPANIENTAQSWLKWQGRTLGSVHFQVTLQYGEEYKQPIRVGNSFKYHHEQLPTSLVSNAIPISHTFSGLSEAIFTCGETARREEARMEERKALETERAGLRQSLTLLESELTRARAHETNAANLLNEVIEIGERVGEVHRTIQRIRVEGLAERRRMIERYYTEESAKYSIVLRSLEAQEAALAAADMAIAAQKANLEASRARLEKLVADAQAAEDALIAEIEKTREALGDNE